MEKVSVLIPAYRGSRQLGRLLESLTEDGYPRKEIIVVISSPSRASKRLAAGFGRGVKFVLNKGRLGKVEALDAGLKKASGDVLFFLDSDNMIEGDNFLSNMVEQMRGVDMVDFPLKAAGRSLLNRMAAIDFTNTNLVGLVYSKASSSKPVLSATALAIRRRAFDDLGGFNRVVSEDLDFGWRAFESGKKYRQVEGGRVVTDTPSSAGEWVRQRKRWAVGAADLFSKHYRSIPSTLARRSVHVTLPLILAFFPMIVLAGIGMLLSNSAVEQMVLFSLVFLPLKFPELTSVVFLILTSVAVFKSVLLYVTGFAVSGALTYAGSRVFGERFSVADYFVYYFLYSPAMMAMFVYGAVRVGLKMGTSFGNWKV